jgi:Uma2 family endonuclease
MATTAAAAVFVPVEEYLRTVYRPDCDYVDGEVLERNMGEKPHARLQGFFCRYFDDHADAWRVEVLPEQRLQVNANRYRIPDVMLAGIPNQDALIVRTPPVLCVEVLSSEDRMKKVQERLDDYASMGVQAMWVVDPWRGTAFFAGGDGVLREVKDRLTVPGTEIGIGVEEIFAELERLEKRAAS